MVNAGRTWLIPACIAGVSWSFRNWIITMVPELRIASDSHRSTFARCCLLHL
jgi:hypothetical protein